MSKDLFDLPAGWSWQPLSALAEIVSGGTPSREVAEYWSPAEIAWVTPTDITGSDGRHLTLSKERISKVGLQKSSAAMLPVGTVLMTSRATLGQAKISAVECCTNQGFKSLVPKTGVPSEYLYYLVQLFKTRYEQLGIGSTFLEVSKKDTEKFMLPVAPEGQRTSIAKILGCVDNQIDATQALIDKYTAIKQGMMADLFSRGIDPETKALRQTFEEAPELYHETPLGMLPKGWVCAPIKKFVQSAEYGISTSLNDDSSGIPVLRMNNIQNNRFNVEDLKFTKDPEAYRLKLSAGDVLYNRTNSMEHVGKTAIWRGELSECSFASYLVRINVNKCELLPEYFSFWMSQESSQNALRAFATPAVQQVNINPTNLQRVLMSCPVSLLEQREIVDRIDAADAVLLREREALLKLNAQKSGLMQDLLTGKVPVPA
ncbi:restriction endonuclease subunit S [Photobacterium damselae]|uniref:restriction endonuclease subunit S n=1 Tax=Photobacterium damselae TaxID=38293 RepID=UPI002543967C